MPNEDYGSQVGATEKAAAAKATQEIRKICEAANLPDAASLAITWNMTVGDEQPCEFVVNNGKRFGYYPHMVGGYQDALEGAKQHALKILAPKVLQQMLGWFSSGDIRELMTEKGEQAEYNRILNAANAIVRGLEL